MYYYCYQLFFLTQSGLGGARCFTNKEQNLGPALLSLLTLNIGLATSGRYRQMGQHKETCCDASQPVEQAGGTLAEAYEGSRFLEVLWQRGI